VDKSTGGSDEDVTTFGEFLTLITYGTTTISNTRAKH
jgi:hypothetical protein